MNKNVSKGDFFIYLKISKRVIKKSKFINFKYKSKTFIFQRYRQ